MHHLKLCSPTSDPISLHRCHCFEHDLTYFIISVFQMSPQALSFIIPVSVLPRTEPHQTLVGEWKNWKRLLRGTWRSCQEVGDVTSSCFLFLFRSLFTSFLHLSKRLTTLAYICSDETYTLLEEPHVWMVLFTQLHEKILKICIYLSLQHEPGEYPVRNVCKFHGRKL